MQKVCHTKGAVNFTCLGKPLHVPLLVLFHISRWKWILCTTPPPTHLSCFLWPIICDDLSRISLISLSSSWNELLKCKSTEEKAWLCLSCQPLCCDQFYFPSPHIDLWVSSPWLTSACQGQRRTIHNCVSSTSYTMQRQDQRIEALLSELVLGLLGNSGGGVVVGIFERFECTFFFNYSHPILLPVFIVIHCPAWCRLLCTKHASLVFTQQ